MKILHLDSNHELLITGLNELGFINHENYTDAKEQIETIIHQYDGIILRSRFKIDKGFLEKATKLKFIGRVGAGLENIDVEFAKQKGIHLLAAPEGNRNAVAEHALGMLLNLTNKLNFTFNQVKNGVWLREENRGIELEGKTIGLIGYGNTGKTFAKKLKGFDTQVIFCDILPNLSDENARQVSLEELKKQADVISLHVPQTAETTYMIDDDFIKSCSKSFILINTARGKCVKTADLIPHLDSGKLVGVALDVLEYEKSSFEKMAVNETFSKLVSYPNIIVTPHIAGWTFESKIKLAQIILDKIKNTFIFEK
jgi:D-3-phosphoglycerate dehydrogenase